MSDRQNDTKQFKNTIEEARRLDEQDPLKGFRDKFYIPIMHGKESVYFTGNSLGLQPKSTQEYVMNELEDWANFGVEGHFHARNPWVSYHELFPPLLTDMTGGHEEELVVMNQLTVNLHLLMASFYRPSGNRNKILCETKPFPSDMYAFASQARLHGLNPDSVIMEMKPQEESATLRTEDIIRQIEKNKDSIALVLFGGVNYYTGQVFDMEAITGAAHEAGALCGFDLAHAIGNVPLKLHDWNVDFACWCSYKYLNSGPGGVAGAFIHERHVRNTDLFRLAGWWGHDKDNRFKMDSYFVPMATAEGWQLSNAPVLSMAAHKASLDVFAEAGMDNLFAKAQLLSDYLLAVIDDINTKTSTPMIQVLTPRDQRERGCQISMVMKQQGKEVFDSLLKNGVIADWREPDVIRVAPVPLYNSFEDIYRFGQIILNILK